MRIYIEYLDLDRQWIRWPDHAGVKVADLHAAAVKVDRALKRGAIPKNRPVRITVLPTFSARSLQLNQTATTPP